MTMTPIHEETFRIPRRPLLERGAELTIERLGRCRFYRATVLDGELVEVDVVDPRNGGIRTVGAERISEIHRKAKLR